MKATQVQAAEFLEIHNRYRRVNERMLILQASVAEGMRKIGEGCTTEEVKAEFVSLKEEIEQILSRMMEICESMNR
ncbi:MAG: hypothetical protein JSV74_07110 [Dehalococcoidia bacterium]|nr:MAG: hypothetical protein JSV74_07110 [Dehalococcoidia bacterium]